MQISMRKNFKDRKIQEWLTLAQSGALALPSFQRSYVWKRPQAVKEYLLAAFQDHPTGVFLVLNTSKEHQFKSRTLKGIEADSDSARELLLDGQQRLTSLWTAVNGLAPVKYYLRITNLIDGAPVLKDIEFASDRSSRGKFLAEPSRALQEELIPLDIIREEPSDEDFDPIWSWCLSACMDNPHSARKLTRRMTKFGDYIMGQTLHYCELSSDTTRREAIDIFVQSNKSSVKVGEFDIAVALAEEEANLRVRDSIAEFHHDSEVTRHYVGGVDNDSEEALSRLGEWVLFSGCIIKKRAAPKRSRFEEVVTDVLAATENSSEDLLRELLENVESALSALAEHGARTRQTVPTLPTLHVLASIQDDLRKLKKASEQALGKRLISAFIWRAFFTKRYEATANDRLFEDFLKLQCCLDSIKKSGRYKHSNLPPIFDESQHPLPTSEELGNLGSPIPWIRSASRLGRAIAALQLERDPFDWITGEKLDIIKVRELEEQGKLDRHHVFPKQILKESFPKEQVDHALNGVLLAKWTNQALSKKDPSTYLTQIANLPSTTSEDELRHRVESHLVPFGLLREPGRVETRYKKFIKERARIVAARMREVCEPPKIK